MALEFSSFLILARGLTVTQVSVQESCELMKDTILTDLQMFEEQRMYKKLLQITVLLVR